MTDEQTDYRISPQSDIDLQLMLTDPKWGLSVPTELKNKLSIIIGEVEHETDQGKYIQQIEESLWELLSFYTRDLRLANLSKFDGEEHYCRYFIDLAGDCLRAGYMQSFLKSLSLAITVMETSQSRGGFLRKRLGTITQEKYTQEVEPPKTGLFGKKKKTDSRY